MYNFKVGNKVFNNSTHVMGILNATPDSFYEKSRVKGDYLSFVEEMINNGAEIIDVGGESTRPNAKSIGALEEMGRVLPIIEDIKNNFDIPLSLDTKNYETAKEGIDLGVDMINLVEFDEDIVSLVAENNISICAMHNRRDSKVPDLMLDKEIGLSSIVQKLEAAGIEKDRILLDGGIGFNKSYKEDWDLLHSYKDLVSSFEYPFLLGTSRKSFLGGEVESRLTATLDTTKIAIESNVLFVRVHDVKENAMLIKVLG